MKGCNLDGVLKVVRHVDDCVIMSVDQIPLVKRAWSNRDAHTAALPLLPSQPELTPLTFPAYFAQKLPFVILFDEHVTPGSGAHAQVAEVVNTGQFGGFTFGWMEL